MFACDGPEGVESFFEQLESFGVEVRFFDGVLEQAAGFLRRVEGAFYGADDGLQDFCGEFLLFGEQRERFFQQAFCSCVERVLFACQYRVGEGQGLSQLFCVVEQVSFGFEILLLVFLGVQGVEFCYGVSGEVCVVGCLLGLLLSEGVLFACALCVLPSFGDERVLLAEFCEGVEERSVR